MHGSIVTEWCDLPEMAVLARLHSGFSIGFEIRYAFAGGRQGSMDIGGCGSGSHGRIPAR
jgi:hypothetical protein